MDCARELKSPNHRGLPVIKKVALTLYYLKDTGSYSTTANTFASHISIVAKIIKDACCVIPCKLGQKYVHLPQIKNATIEKASEFEAKYGMHQDFRCIDGTHVAIIRPAEYSQDYICCKQFFSVSFQAFCDFLSSTLWMLTAAGLRVFMIQGLLQIQPFSKN